MKKLNLISGVAVAGALFVSSIGSAALAAPMTVHAPAADGIAALNWSPGDDIAERHRWRHRRDRGIDGGDILAGVLIVGGIAAIASAASNKANERRYERDSRYRYDGYNYDNRYRSNELNAAADQCAFAAEDRAGNGARVDRISTVARDGSGWRVEGSVSYDGGYDEFQCGVTNGQIDYIQLGN